MKILAIDSSGQVASVAIVDGAKLVGEYTMNYKLTHSQTLLPMLDELAQMIQLDMKTVDAFAIAAGPGSFTGLRIGSATVKGFGLALNKPIISVPTIDAMAMNLWGTDALVCPLMDARRQQTYTGLYEFKDGELVTVSKQVCCMIGDVIEQINTLGRKVIFLGDGVSAFAGCIADHITVPYSFAPAHCNEQHASSVAVLAEKLYREGKYESAEQHKPDYLRLSQAEQEQKQGLTKDFLI